MIIFSLSFWVLVIRADRRLPLNLSSPFVTALKVDLRQNVSRTHHWFWVYDSDEIQSLIKNVSRHCHIQVLVTKRNFSCHYTNKGHKMHDGEQSRQAAAQIAEWLAVAWNGPAYDALAGVCFCSGRAWPCSGAAKVASEMTSFTSRWRMRAHPAGAVAEDASTRVMTGGFAFHIVYPLLAALQACTDINAPTTLRHDNGNQHHIS